MSIFRKDPSGDPEPEKENTLPEGVKPPPEITLPKPDGFAKSNQQEQANAIKAKKERDQRQSKERRHPKDPYKPMKNKTGCGCAGCGCLTLLITVLLPLAGLGWLMAPVAEFERVTSQEETFTISESAEAPATYFANTLVYTAPETPTEVAFAGAEVTLSGLFSEKVYVRAYKLTVTEDAVFLKGLDVYAVEFENNSQRIEGELTGSVATQTTK